MMHRNYISLSVLSIIISFAFLSISIPSCDANYADWGVIFEGSTFHNGTHITMPYADVSINITRYLSSIYIFMNSEFHITTNTTQNATLAFVYPSYTDDLGNYSTSVNDLLQIFQNGTEIRYTVVQFDDFVDSGFTDDIYSYTSIPVDFAVFEVELTANTTMVYSTVSFKANNGDLDRFDYNYIVGSARTFEGHTMERVQIRVVEDVPFVSKSFGPNESLSITENGLVTVANWNINSSEFSQDYVHFSAMVKSQGIDLIGTLSITAVVIFIVFCIYQFGYKKSIQGH